MNTKNKQKISINLSNLCQSKEAVKQGLIKTIAQLSQYYEIFLVLRDGDPLFDAEDI